jgi:probable F420-dependent oxidoreductase
MRVETSLPNDDLQAVGTIAADLEAAGFDAVNTQENRHDPFLPLAIAATSTTRLGLATNVAIAFPRSPMMTAGVSWDLQKASGGRFELGLGSQVKGHNVRRFSVPWSAPAPRMQEYIESIRAIWRTWVTGERLDYQGEHYQFTLMTPNFTPEPLDSAPPAITLAAVGPGMLRVAGRVADGVRLHGFCTREYIENQVMPQLQTGLDQRGRDRSDLAIYGGGFICTGPDDEAVAKAVDWVRYRVGFYGSTRAYWPVLEQHDLLELGEKLNHLSKNDGWDHMAELVSDDVVRLFAAVGRHDQLVDAVTERFGGLTDSISLGAGGGPDGQVPPGLIEDLKAI